MRRHTQRERERRGRIEGYGRGRQGLGRERGRLGMEGRGERENTDMSIYFKKSECLVAL